jgi:hypothetical protein
MPVPDYTPAGDLAILLETAAALGQAVRRWVELPSYDRPHREECVAEAEALYRDLVRLAARHGLTRPPRPWEDPDGFDLWVHEATGRLERPPANEREGPEVVDLDQIAAWAHRKKDSLKPYKRRKKDPLPEPDFPGGRGGKRDYWLWSTVRSWLARNFPLPFPEHVPNVPQRRVNRGEPG